MHRKPTALLTLTTCLTLATACGGPPAAARPQAPATDPVGRESDARAAFDAAFSLRLEGRELEAMEAFRSAAVQWPETRAGLASASATEQSAFLTAMIAISAGAAIPAFQKYQVKARSAEAELNLDALLQAATAYWQAEPTATSKKGKPPPRRFPDSAPPTPGAPVCVDGKPNAVIPDAQTFAHPTWRALGFSPTGPLRFRYEVLSSVSEGRAHLTLRAVGDPDCDGVLSTFTRAAHGNPDGTVEPVYSEGD